MAAALLRVAPISPAGAGSDLTTRPADAAHPWSQASAVRPAGRRRGWASQGIPPRGRPTRERGRCVQPASSPEERSPPRDHGCMPGRLDDLPPHQRQLTAPGCLAWLWGGSDRTGPSCATRTGGHSVRRPQSKGLSNPSPPPSGMAHPVRKSPPCTSPRGARALTCLASGKLPGRKPDGPVAEEDAVSDDEHQAVPELPEPAPGDVAARDQVAAQWRDAPANARRDVEEAAAALRDDPGQDSAAALLEGSTARSTTRYPPAPGSQRTGRSQACTSTRTAASRRHGSAPAGAGGRPSCVPDRTGRTAR